MAEFAPMAFYHPSLYKVEEGTAKEQSHENKDHNTHVPKFLQPAEAAHTPGRVGRNLLRRGLFHHRHHHHHPDKSEDREHSTTSTTGSPGRLSGETLAREDAGRKSRESSTGRHVGLERNFD